MGRINAPLPFNNAGATAFQGGAANLGANYASSYNAALDMNKSNYNNIIGGYHQAADALNVDQNKIAAGYAGLDNRVMSGIDTIGGARRNEIADQYAAQRGQASQDLTSRGLGNSTVVQSVNRGIGADEAKAYTGLADNLAGMKAQYQTSIGQANLGYLDHANAQRNTQANEQLGFMNSVSSPYPNAGLYSQLAQQYGAAGGSVMTTGAVGHAGPVTAGGSRMGQPSSPGGGYGEQLVGAGGFVHDPSGGAGTAAIRDDLGLKPMPGSPYQPEVKPGDESGGAGSYRGPGGDALADQYGGALGGFGGAAAATDYRNTASLPAGDQDYQDAYGYAE